MYSTCSLQEQERRATIVSGAYMQQLNCLESVAGTGESSSEEECNRPALCQCHVQNTENNQKTLTEDRCSRLGYLPLKIGHEYVDALVDTGASISALPKSLVDTLRELFPMHLMFPEKGKTYKIRTADGKAVPTLGTVIVHFAIGSEEYFEKFLILETMNTPILGWPFFERQDFKIDCRKRILFTKDMSIQMNHMLLQEEEAEMDPLVAPKKGKTDKGIALHTTKTLTLPAGRLDYVTCELSTEDQNLTGLTGVVESFPAFVRKTGVDVGDSLSTVNNDKQVNVGLLNAGDHTYTIPAGTRVATIEVMTAKQSEFLRPIPEAIADRLHTCEETMQVTVEEFNALTYCPVDPDKPQKEEAAEGDYWFATPENCKDPEKLTGVNKEIYERIVKCKELEKLDPTESPAMRAKFLSNFSWKKTIFTKKEVALVEALLVKHHKIFARHKYDIGGNDEFKVKLTPEHDGPVVAKSPPTSIHLKEQMMTELALMQYYGILKTLPYAKYSSPIFAQRKPNGDLRILFDLRRINHLIRHDYDDNNFPVASMEEAAYHMAWKVYFSKVDCAQAYHAMKMADERSMQLLAFNFESRVFAYTRLAQGLSRSATAFSSFIRHHLAADIAADRCSSFMDDVCAAQRTFAEHYDALDHVFASIGRSGLRLTMHKCEFGVAEIKFLGWTVSKQGVGPQKDKIDAQLAIIKMPRNVKTAQRMIGFMQYYRAFIPWLSEKLLPFYKLTRPGSRWYLGPEHWDSLKKLKTDLRNATLRVLRLPLAGKQFVLMTDASDWAAGYVLLIEDYTKDQEGKETKTYAPVAFGSKKFTQGQYNMTTHAKEFLAVYYAFDSFAHILWGITTKPVIVLTDNKALSSFLQAKTLPPTLCKYVDKILQFEFALSHIPGKANPAADYLSRMHHNPHLHIDITIKGKIPTFEVQVDVLPKVQGDVTQDGGKPNAPLYDDGTPDEWPPADGTNHDLDDDGSGYLYPDKPMLVEINSLTRFSRDGGRSPGERALVPRPPEQFRLFGSHWAP